MSVGDRSADERAAVALRWLAEGRRVVAATLIETDGSSPLQPGATMLVDEAGTVEGSVSGGCVEGALVEEARTVLEGGPAHVVTYGISDELAGTVGLTCGGTIHVLVHELGAAAAEAVAACLAAGAEGRPAAVAILADGPHAGATLGVVGDEVVGTLRGPELLDRSVGRDAAGLLEQGHSALRHYGSDGATMGSDLRVFVRAYAPPPRMVIFGATDFAAALAPIAAELGYHVTICDAREPFVRSPRFARAAEVAVDWPDRYIAGRRFGPRDAILVFTHDPKFDEPAIVSALATDVGYIGALGSRRTVEERGRRLRDAGVGESELERLYSPCGLDLGAHTPAETAVSILAEIVALRSRRSGEHLRETDAPVHADRARAGVE
jgi:xanthine dehydrogenase accessory factor